MILRGTGHAGSHKDPSTIERVVILCYCSPAATDEAKDTAGDVGMTTSEELGCDDDEHRGDSLKLEGRRASQL